MFQFQLLIQFSKQLVSGFGILSNIHCFAGAIFGEPTKTKWLLTDEQISSNLSVPGTQTWHPKIASQAREFIIRLIFPPPSDSLTVTKNCVRLDVTGSYPLAAHDEDFHFSLSHRVVGITEFPPLIHSPRGKICHMSANVSPVFRGVKVGIFKPRLQRRKKITNERCLS